MHLHVTPALPLFQPNDLSEGGKTPGAATTVDGCSRRGPETSAGMAAEEQLPDPGRGCRDSIVLDAALTRDEAVLLAGNAAVEKDQKPSLPIQVKGW